MGENIEVLFSLTVYDTTNFIFDNKKKIARIQHRILELYYLKPNVFKVIQCNILNKENDHKKMMLLIMYGLEHAMNNELIWSPATGE
jgi:hypothetical protein